MKKEFEHRLDEVKERLLGTEEYRFISSKMGEVAPDQLIEIAFQAGVEAEYMEFTSLLQADIRKQEKDKVLLELERLSKTPDPQRGLPNHMFEAGYFRALADLKSFLN